MNRRQFLGMTIGGVVAGAAVRTWPYRVFSFPSTPRRYVDITRIDSLDLKYWGMKYIKHQFEMADKFMRLIDSDTLIPISSRIIRIPLSI